MANSWHCPLSPSEPHRALKPLGTGQHFLSLRLSRSVQTLGNWPSTQCIVTTTKIRYVMVGLTILWTAPWETKFRSCCYQSFEFRRSIIMWNRYLYLILIVLIMVITMMIRITIMVKMIIEKLSNREKLGMLFLLVFEEKMKLKTNEVKAIWIFFNIIRVTTVRSKHILCLCCLSHLVLTLFWQRIYHRNIYQKV